MNCLVTGGSGFLGQHIAAGLLAAGHEVAVLDRRSSAVPGAPCMVGDAFDRAQVKAALEGKDAIVHLAWTTVPGSSGGARADIEENLAGTVEILDACVEQGVQRVVFPSSGGTVYGVTAHVPIAETAATDPISSYGIAKLAAEKYLQLYGGLHGLRSIVLRLANPYGPGQDGRTGQGLVGRAIQNAFLGRPIDVWGKGDAVRDYVHVTDVARAFVAAMEYDGSARVFNIGSGQGRSVLQVLDAVEGATGHRIVRRLLPARGVDVPYNVLDCGAARRELGWRSMVSFAEGLQSTVAAYERARGKTSAS